MAEVVLFHHSQGLTAGVHAFADEVRAAGHTVHTPDLYGGRTFDSIEDGMGYAQSLPGINDMGDLANLGNAAVENLPANVVYAGFSLGVMPAQKLTQTRPGALGALFYHSCAPFKFFGTWPDGVPVQIHGMDADPFFVGEGDVDAARQLVAHAAGSELFLYPGDGHLFADRSLDGYDAGATTLLLSRTLDFLAAR